MLTLGLIYLFFNVIFGILGMQLFEGKFSSCNDTSEFLCRASYSLSSAALCGLWDTFAQSPL